LAEPPAAPEERFGVLEHGSLAHSVLRHLHEGDLLPYWPEQLDALFDRLFREECRKAHVVLTHQVEWDRLELLRNLRAYLKASPAARGWRSEVEWAFEFALRDDLWVRGRIDRFDESPTGDVRAIDYKYSKADLKKRFDAPDAVQGGLYLLALRSHGKNPVGFAYVPLKGDGKIADAPDPLELMEQAEQRTLSVVDQVRQGVIEPKPSDLNNCKWCTYRDACRARERVAAQAAAGGAASEDAE
jgi:RecB family exonuclease